MDEIGDSTGLGHFELGLLGALPLLMFALCSPLAGRTARSRGIEVSIAAALAGIVIGTAVRSTAGIPGLWIGTALAGASIAVANVLTPTLLKRDFAKPALATAVFTTALSGAAALGAGSAVPLSESIGGWRWALLFWGLLPALVLPVWLMRAALVRSDVAPDPLDPMALRHVARSRISWQVTFFFGLQSLIFYTLITWLPGIEQSVGISAKVSGLHLLAFQLVGCPIGIVIGLLMERRSDQRLAVLLVSVPMVVSMLGFAAAPQLALLWVLVGSTGSGAALGVALALVVLRTSRSSHTTALSGMAQSLGYFVAALGPIGAGAMSQATGWRPVLVVLGLVAIVQLVVGLSAARDGFIPTGAPDRSTTRESPTLTAHGA